MTILRFGHPVLSQVCTRVQFNDPDLEDESNRLLSALAAFQSHYGWGRAISAPQIGIEKRMMAVDLPGGPTVLLNPELTWVSTEVREVWDDCMSLPEIAVRVGRHESVSIRYAHLDGVGAKLEEVPFELSELLQHELDHLDGVLMTQRMVPGSPIIAREMRSVAGL